MKKVVMLLAAEPVRAYLVHHEATFDHDELHRHITVLALTPTRLVVGHTGFAWTVDNNSILRMVVLRPLSRVEWMYQHGMRR